MSRLNRFLNNANQIIEREKAFVMRRRLNPHHSDEHRKAEITLNQVKNTKLFFKLKEELADHRDELFAEAHGFPEALKMLRCFEQIINDDIEKVLLGE